MNAIYENHLRARTTMIFFLIAGAVNTSVSRSSERSSSYVKKLHVMTLNQAALQVRNNPSPTRTSMLPGAGATRRLVEEATRCWPRSPGTTYLARGWSTHFYFSFWSMRIVDLRIAVLTISASRISAKHTHNLRGYGSAMRVQRMLLESRPRSSI